MAERGMFEVEEKSGGADWAIRIGIAGVFLVAGVEKFGMDPHWVKMFQQIGWGKWFRYLSGVVEVGSAVLVLISKTATAGLALLAVTMAAAAAIHFAVLRDGNSWTFPALLAAGITGFAFLRRSL